MSREAETRIVKWLQAIFTIGAFALIFTIANATIVWRTKSALEQRVEALEWGRRDQQERNKATDTLLTEILKELENANPAVR